MPKHEFIHDPVYGLVPLGQSWYELLNRPWFQRLRRIRQNGVLFLVFPGSEHTRFTHTIGVLHLMRRLARHVLDPQRCSKSDYSDPYKWLVYCLGALFHDSAHLPFSHVTEDVYASFTRDGFHIADLHRSKGAFVGGPRLFDSGLVRTASLLLPQTSSYHESMAKRVIEAVFSDRLVPVIIRRITEDEKLKCRKTSKIDIERLKADVVKVVKDPLGPFGVMNPLKSGVDVDNLDYMARDSRAAGVPYGDVALEHLIQHVTCSKYKPMHRRKKIPTLAFDSKRLHALEHMLMGRYFLYANVILHPTNQAWTTILRAILLGLIESDELIGDTAKQLESCLRDPMKHHLLTDDYLDLAALSHNGTNGELNELCSIWCQRKSPDLYWKWERLLESPSGSLKPALMPHLHNLIDQFISGDHPLRKRVFPAVQFVRVLPREHGDRDSAAKIDLTTYVVDTQIESRSAKAVPIQDRDECVLNRLRGTELVMLTVFVWGENDTVVAETTSILDAKNARRELDQHADELARLLNPERGEAESH